MKSHSYFNNVATYAGSFGMVMQHWLHASMRTGVSVCSRQKFIHGSFLSKKQYKLIFLDNSAHNLLFSSFYLLFGFPLSNRYSLCFSPSSVVFNNSKTLYVVLSAYIVYMFLGYQIFYTFFHNIQFHSRPFITRISMQRVLHGALHRLAAA